MSQPEDLDIDEILFRQTKLEYGFQSLSFARDAGTPDAEREFGKPPTFGSVAERAGVICFDRSAHNDAVTARISRHGIDPSFGDALSRIAQIQGALRKPWPWLMKTENPPLVGPKQDTLSHWYVPSCTAMRSGERGYWMAIRYRHAYRCKKEGGASPPRPITPSSGAV